MMSGKHSGSWFKKRRQEREESAKKAKGSFEKYLIKPNDTTLREESYNESPSTSGKTNQLLPQEYATEKTDTESPSTSGGIIQIQPQECPRRITAIEPPSTSAENNERQLQEFQNNFVEMDVDVTDNAVELLPENSISPKVTLDYADPASWDTLNINRQTLRTILVEHGPDQVKGKFPKGVNNRKFSDFHYRRRLPNGEYVYRDYLQYSKSTDKVFCFCCKVFGGINVSSSLGKSGCNDWHNMSALLETHETSNDHLQNFEKWKTLKKALKKNLTVDNVYEQKIKQEEIYWQKILERLFALVKTLGSQNLSFRGTTEKLDVNDNGNFLKFIEYLAMFDPIMNEHLRKIKSDVNRHTHYLGKNIQNEMIQTLANAINADILSSVHTAKYFSIILDCTPDVSHVEQMTIIIRFVELPKSSLASSTEVSSYHQVLVKEHFLGFVPLTESTSGEYMTEVVLEKLKEISLPVENIRGQGYDNGSNMRGKESGVQKRILDVNPRAFYVPCCSHTLNLVVNDAASCCVEVTTFFDVVQRTYVFFSASTRRWDVLRRHVPALTLKPLSDTRWSSRIDALTPLRYHLSHVCDALEEISEDTSLKGSSGSIAKVEALGLLKHLSDFKFIVALVTWHNILFQVNLTSKILQEKDLSLQKAVSHLKKTEEFLVTARSDVQFQRVLVDAKEVAEEVGIEPIFEREKVRIRKKKKMFDYESTDESANVASDPSESFKIQFYFALLDTAANAVKERFSQLNTVSGVFGFLYNITDLKNKTTSEVKSMCNNLEKSLGIQKDGRLIESDIDAVGLCSELKAISHHLIDSISSPEEVLNYIYQHNLENGFPNICVALRILLTMPLSVASAERSFSKLKLIKTYLRSTMCQERLVGLATISIESERARQVDLKVLIQEFAKQKARKVPLGL